MSQTLQNLSAAFIGESQARNRYTIYAKVAKKEGYEQVSAVFEETAEQEREHAKWLMRMIQDLKGSEIVSIEADVPNTLGTTAENLSAAIGGENHEHTSMYPDFAATAESEGHQAIADRLRSIAIAESHHEERFAKLLEQIKAGTVFKKDQEATWMCRKCGYVHTATTAPEKCPSCDHPQAYYQLKCEKY